MGVWPQPRSRLPTDTPPPGRCPGLVIRGYFQTRIRKGKPHGKGKPGSLARPPALQTPSRRGGGGPAAPCLLLPGPPGGRGTKGESGERTERAPGRRGAAGSGASGRAGGRRPRPLGGLCCPTLPNETAQSKRKGPPTRRGYSQQEAHGDGGRAGPAAAWARRGSARLPMAAAAAAEGGRVRGERRGAGTRPARPPSPPAAPAPLPLPPSQLRGSGMAALPSEPWGSPSGVLSWPQAWASPHSHPAVPAPQRSLCECPQTPPWKRAPPAPPEPPFSPQDKGGQVPAHRSTTTTTTRKRTKKY